MGHTQEKQSVTRLTCDCGATLAYGGGEDEIVKKWKEQHEECKPQPRKKVKK